MGNDDNSGSSGSQGNFWTTLPGVITAVTGLIGAITALIAGLHQAGLLASSGQPATPTPSISPTPSTPPTPVAALDTPEDLLVDFYRFLVKKQFDKAQVIYPAWDGEDMEDWLGGRGTRSPIRNIIVHSTDELVAEQSATRATVRATLLFCREDRTGTNEKKNFYFVKVGDSWVIRRQKAIEPVSEITC